MRHYLVIEECPVHLIRRSAPAIRKRLPNAAGAARGYAITMRRGTLLAARRWFRNLVAPVFGPLHVSEEGQDPAETGTHQGNRAADDFEAQFPDEIADAESDSGPNQDTYAPDDN